MTIKLIRKYLNEIDRIGDPMQVKHTNLHAIHWIGLQSLTIAHLYFRHLEYWFFGQNFGLFRILHSKFVFYYVHQKSGTANVDGCRHRPPYYNKLRFVHPTVLWVVRFVTQPKLFSPESRVASTDDAFILGRQWLQKEVWIRNWKKWDNILMTKSIKSFTSLCISTIVSKSWNLTQRKYLRVWVSNQS